MDPSINTTQEEILIQDRALRTFRHRPSTYDEMVRAAAARNPLGEAIVCGNRRLSYRDLDDFVERIASGLIGAGLTRGERVAVLLDNCLEYLVAILATIRAGGIAVPIGTRLGPADVAHIVENAAPLFAITATEWRRRFPERSSVRSFHIIDLPESDDESFGHLFRGPLREMPKLQPEDTIVIMYTSGTSGKPKGVCLTHVNFIHTCLHYLYALAIDRPQRALLVIPATHIAGFGPLMSVTLASAGTVVMMREFKARAVLETIARERITFAVMVPAMYQLCAMDPTFAQRDISAWRYAVYGGAVMPPAVIEWIARQAPNLRLINAYGATETCAVCTIMPPELTAQAPASVGLPLQCDDLAVIDSGGCETGPGQPGELWIRGPNVSPGYWRDPDATAKAFRDGFWMSGDIATRDERGLVFIHDRIKDMINRGGFKVFSAEVENALMEHPGVAECAVVGVPDAVLGEKTFAFVTRKTPDVDGPALREFLAARIADYKTPDFWRVGDAPIARNQNGKIQKTKLRQLALELLENSAGERGSK